MLLTYDDYIAFFFFFNIPFLLSLSFLLVFFDISNNNFTITSGVSCTAPIATAPTVTQPTCAVATGTIVVNATGTGTLEYSVNNKPIAVLAQISNKKLKEFDIHQSVFYARMNWMALTKILSKQKVVFTEPSKFPSVKRDLALLINKAITYSEIEKLAFSVEKKFLKEVNLFDIYEGEKLGNKKSYAVSFTLLNTEATLTDKQIDAVMQKLIATYKDKLGAEIR